MHVALAFSRLSLCLTATMRMSKGEAPVSFLAEQEVGSDRHCDLVIAGAAVA